MQPDIVSRVFVTVAKRIPTQVGDVLVLRTGQSYTTHVVGLIAQDGQQDFQGQTDLAYVDDRAAAVTQAKALVEPGRRIFFRDIDTDDWSEIQGTRLGRRSRHRLL